MAEEIIELTDVVTLQSITLELLAARANKTVAEIEAKLKTDAVETICKAEIDEVIKRIRNKKVDEAKAYQPTDEEIIVALDAKIPQGSLLP